MSILKKEGVGFYKGATTNGVEVKQETERRVNMKRLEKDLQIDLNEYKDEGTRWKILPKKD